MNVAFIGMGIMGSPMAIRLLSDGHSVVGFNRSPRKMEPFVRAGGNAASSIRDAVVRADVAITMLPDSPDVENVALAPEGVLAHLRPGSLFIDMSTVSPIPPVGWPTKVERPVSPYLMPRLRRRTGSHGRHFVDHGRGRSRRL